MSKTPPPTAPPPSGPPGGPRHPEPTHPETGRPPSSFVLPDTRRFPDFQTGVAVYGR